MVSFKSFNSVRSVQQATMYVGNGMKIIHERHKTKTRSVSHPPQTMYFCKISGSHGGEYEDGCLLGCCEEQYGRSTPTFQWWLLPQTSP
jgi:hypothetical protein